MSQVAVSVRPRHAGRSWPSVSVSADSLAAMAAKGKGGRPHKGTRKLVHTRLPVDEAEEIDGLADERGETRNDYVAALLRLGLKHRHELPPPAQTVLDQGRLALEQAS